MLDTFKETLGVSANSKCLVDGQWVASMDQNVFQVTNPATQLTLASVPDFQVADAERAVSAAEKGFQIWRQYSAKKRSQILYRWYEKLIEYKRPLAELMTAEQGKPLTESEGEVEYGAAYIQWFAEESKRINGDIIPPQNHQQRILVTKEPVGVCVAVTPWNFPIAMITRKAAAALAAGCSMVIKPAEATPLSALAVCKLALDAGVPDGVLNVITTSDPKTVVKYLCDHKSVKKISFTGSTAVGKSLMQQSAGTLKKLSLELGGNAPFIVMDDADIEAAVRGAMASKFRNAGQTCVCANRFLIHRNVIDEFSEKLAHSLDAFTVGVGTKEGVDQGPLINEQAVSKVESHIEDAVAQGGRILRGGSRHELGGTFFQPTIIVDGKASMKINHEETFGPVALLIPIDSAEEAIEIANDTDFGLAAYAYTQNLANAMTFSHELEYGMVGINEGVISNEMAPFGGIKESGMGREGSSYGIEDYLNIKYTLLGGL